MRPERRTNVDVAVSGWTTLVTAGTWDDPTVDLWADREREAVVQAEVLADVADRERRNG
jgi:hypothetical protein